MNHDIENILVFVDEIAREMRLKKNVESIEYREDYQDFRVFLDDNSHCEIREKLVDILIANSKHADSRREVEFRLRHSVEFEEWEEDVPKQGAADIELDTE